jgi:hypothetical protein
LAALKIRQKIPFNQELAMGYFGLGASPLSWQKELHQRWDLRR